MKPFVVPNVTDNWLSIDINQNSFPKNVIFFAQSKNN